MHVYGEKTETLIASYLKKEKDFVALSLGCKTHVHRWQHQQYGGHQRATRDCCTVYMALLIVKTLLNNSFCIYYYLF